MKQICQKRGDIILLVRNFNYFFVNVINSFIVGGVYYLVFVLFYSFRLNLFFIVTISIFSIVERVENYSEFGVFIFGIFILVQILFRDIFLFILEFIFQDINYTYISTEFFIQSSGEMRFFIRFYNFNKLELDENGRVEVYVDFSEFYDVIKKLIDFQIEFLNVETKFKLVYELIIEEVDFLLVLEN